MTRIYSRNRSEIFKEKYDMLHELMLFNIFYEKFNEDGKHSQVGLNEMHTCNSNLQDLLVVTSKSVVRSFQASDFL